MGMTLLAGADSRQRATCTRPMPNSAAMAIVCFPCSASNTMRARCTKRTLVRFERASLVNSNRSSSVSLIVGATRIFVLHLGFSTAP
jgi:hypothetical protein